MLRVTSICDRGLARAINQDRIGCFFQDEKGLFLVSDGMGGHYAGEKASETTLTAFSGWWDSYLSAPQRPNFSRAVEQLQNLIQQVNQTVRQLTPSNQLCGATLTALLLFGQSYAVFSTGDSRCYQIGRRGGIVPYITQLTTDDIVRNAAWKQDNGKLLSAIGISEVCKVSLQTGRAPAHTIFALCSDGVYKMCPKKDWEQSLRSAAFGGSLQKTMINISKAVQKNGAKDNFSLILVKI